MTSFDAEFKGNLVILGFGSIAQAFLPLLFKHIHIGPQQVTIISRSEDKTGIAAAYQVHFIADALTEDNYQNCLDKVLQEHDFLLNLSVEVASHALIEYCWLRDILYLDTCTEPWPGQYTNAQAPLAQRTNYQLREALLAFRKRKPQGPTAVITHGANPGLVSAFVKQALINLAHDLGVEKSPPANQQDWALLAQQLGVKTIHIAERDSQLAASRKQRDVFVNTWSVNGFLSEGLQPAELGWGSHEKHLPDEGHQHELGTGAAIYFSRPGLGTRVRSWTPQEGSYIGFLVTHAESISIADYLTLRAHGSVIYRPTAHYAYHPCDDAVLSILEMEGKHWAAQASHHILRDDITAGMDELGVLLMGHDKGSYWYGSRLEIAQARDLAPHNTATSLQVVAGVLAGMLWALKHPRSGLVEPDDLDYAFILQAATPYLGDMVGVYSDWTPLKDRGHLFPQSVDKQDPWQFLNFRVN